MADAAPPHLDRHAQTVGKLVGYFQALESNLRAFLYERGVTPHHPFGTDKDLARVKPGDEVQLNAFTSYDTLGQLITKFNRVARNETPRVQVDPTLVQVRDALAQGRVWIDHPDLPVHLLKFERPKAGVTRVAYHVIMTPEWLKVQTQVVQAEVVKVASLLSPPRKLRARPSS
jgi:hypothetical protein